MKELKKHYINKRIIITAVFIVFIIGLLFGSIYMNIIDNSEKKDVVNSVKNFIYSYEKITFIDKIGIFKDTFIKNLLYFITIWLLGISIIGIPIIIVMIFLKAFVTGFSISGLFVTYKFKGLLYILSFMIPSNIIFIIITILLGTYSIDLSIKLFSHAIKKKTFNFGIYMGKYLFLLFIIIILVVVLSLYESFINPYIFKLFTKLIK